MSTTGKRYSSAFKEQVRGEYLSGSTIPRLAEVHRLSKSTISLWVRKREVRPEYENTKKQGDAGVGMAIGWFASRGWTVSIPLTDSQDYDLIVDNGAIQRVQVKSTSFKSKYGVFTISLTVKGGNRSGTGKIKKFDKTKVDAVFALTSTGDMYFIPVNAVATSSISLGHKMQKYRVTF